MPHLTFSVEKPGNVVFQPQEQKYKSTGPEKELICHAMVIS